MNRQIMHICGFKSCYRFATAIVITWTLICVYIAYNDVSAPKKVLHGHNKEAVDKSLFDVSAYNPNLSADPPHLSADPPPPFGSRLVLAENHPGEDGRFPMQDYLHIRRAKPEFPPIEIDEEERRRLWNSLDEKLMNERVVKKLPDIIGIGVQKCGTFALKHFLSYHPLVKAHRGEGNFFNNVPPSTYDRPNYLNILDRVPKSAYLMEKTPGYFWDPETPLRMKTVDPKAKLFLIVCDPTHRVISNIFHEILSLRNKTLGVEIKTKYKSVDQFVSDVLPVIKRTVGRLQKRWNVTTLDVKRKQISELRPALFMFGKGFYLLHLLPWLKYYNESNLLIVNGNEMLMDPGSVLERVQAFLRLPRLLFKSDFVKDPKTGFFCFKDWRKADKLICMPERKRRTRNKEVLSQENIEKLKNMYSSYNEALYTALGARFDW